MNATAEPRVVILTTVPASLIFLRGQGQYLRSCGYDVHVISSPGQQLERFGGEEGATVHALLMERRIQPLKDIVTLIKLIRLLRTLRPDVVHAHTPKAGLLGMLAAWALHVPVRIYHIHGLPFETAAGLRRKLLWSTEWLACHTATRVLCVSWSALNVAVASGTCGADHGTVLVNGSVNGIDAEHQFNPDEPRLARSKVRAELGLPVEAPVIGYVGRLVRDKGCDVLLEAWRKLRVDFPDARLLIVGAADTRDAISAETFESLTSDPRVAVTGWVAETAMYYAAMDVLAFPTLREGFGLVAAEGAAMRIPVVAGRVTGCIDVVSDGETGRLVAPGDPEPLYEAIVAYLKDPHLRERHGVAGRQRVLSRFDARRIWDQLAIEYRTSRTRVQRRAAS